jgi:hypothetical protein
MTFQASEMHRRILLQSAAGLAVGLMAQGVCSAAVTQDVPAESATAPASSPSAISGNSVDQGDGAASVPPATTRTPGKPGDFDFLAGEWKISHRQLKADGITWDEYEGEATCWTILGGVGSVEELRIPARKFSGMGLRLLDVQQQLWSDFWVNARSGVLATPGMSGSFEDGSGIFIADDMDGDRAIKVRGVWDRITPNSCRWHQAISRDGGKTWQENWFMDWVRV